MSKKFKKLAAVVSKELKFKPGHLLFAESASSDEQHQKLCRR